MRALLFLVGGCVVFGAAGAHAEPKAASRLDTISQAAATTEAAPTSMLAQVKPPSAPPAVVLPGPAATASVTPAPAAQKGLDDGHTLHAVRLRVDGNLAGRATSFDAAGVRRPAQVKVYFIQNHQIISSASADEWGRFQMLGLKPGTYSAVAVGKGGIAAVAVRVRPFEEAQPTQVGEGQTGRVPVIQVSYAEVDMADPFTFDMNMIPATDSDLLTDLIKGNVPPGTPAPAGTAAATPAAAAGGGGGGGGMLGGILAALGSALGGIGGGIGGAGGGGGGFLAPSSQSTPTP